MYLEEHINQKRAIYERYKAGLAYLLIKIKPYDVENSVPSFWLSYMIIDSDAICQTVHEEKDELWITETRKSCTGEMLAAFVAFNAEGRPIWKPISKQPIYRLHGFITKSGNGRVRSNAYIK